LESLNLCGTRITGLCLDQLSANMKRLDISYCWSVQEEGLLALARAPCRGLVELSVNNFDFDRSENCMIALCNQFGNLKYLQMSIGPCVAQDYFIDRVTRRGFSAIAKLKDLETLIIEKICVMDNNALMDIINNCTRLKCLRLNLGWWNHCTDACFRNIGTKLLDLEELHLSYPSVLTTSGMCTLVNLRKLNSLSLVNTGIDNGIFKYIDGLDHLTEINLDDCRKITLRGLYHLCRIANRRPNVTIHGSLLGTGIIVARLEGSKKTFPQNLKAQISNYRATKYHTQIP
jgi:hypothetical protein